MYQEMRRNQDRIIGWDTNLFFEAIAALEAREPKVMSDEEIDKMTRTLWPPVPTNDHVDASQTMCRRIVSDGIKYLRDHGYLAPLDGSRMQEAGDAMKRWIEYAAPHYCDEQDRFNAERAMEKWESAKK